MKKLVILLILLMFVSTMIGSITLLNTNKFVKTYYTTLDILAITHYENEDVYEWLTHFVDKVTNTDKLIKCYLQYPPAKIRDIIDSGRYKIRIKVVYDSMTDRYYFWPIWSTSIKKVNIQILKFVPKGKKI